MGKKIATFFINNKCWDDNFTFSNNKQSYVLNIYYIYRCTIRYNVSANNTINMATETWPTHDARSAGTTIVLTWFNHSKKSVHSAYTLDPVLAHTQRRVNVAQAYLSRGIEQCYPVLSIIGHHFESNQQ